MCLGQLTPSTVSFNEGNWGREEEREPTKESDQGGYPWLLGLSGSMVAIGPVFAVRPLEGDGDR